MSQPVMPDSLVNSLIKHRDGAIKRVVRDDGENGLQISPPEAPALMRPITREAFQNEWQLFMTVSDQLKDTTPGVAEVNRPFRNGDEKSRVVGVDLSSQMTLPSIDSRNGVNEMQERAQKFGNMAGDPFEGRTTASHRPQGDELEQTLKTPLPDVTFSGEPVGGNEMPAASLEEDRADDDGMANAPVNAQEAVQAQHGDPEPAKRTTKTRGKTP